MQLLLTSAKDALVMTLVDSGLLTVGDLSESPEHTPGDIACINGCILGRQALMHIQNVDTNSHSTAAC